MLMDYVLHNYMMGDMEHFKNTWLPLGHNSKAMPASPSHILPASRRRWFCLFRGSLSSDFRKLIDEDLKGAPELGCRMEWEVTDGVSYRNELVQSVVSICPPGANYDTVNISLSLSLSLSLCPL